MSDLPADVRQFLVPREVLEDTQELLAEPGERGLEAVVVWLGVAKEAAGHVLEVIRPAQIAYRSENGLAVEVPPESLSALISGLPDGVVILARVHSHPAEPYHSTLDDTNMLISHQGAISIVVGYFAQEAIVLEHCSVNELRHGTGWVELSPTEVQQRFEVR